MTIEPELLRAPRDSGRTAARPPLVLFAPFPPVKSGIAAYVSELMPYHLAEFDVTLVIADDAPEPMVAQSGPRILLASEFRKHRSYFEFAPKVYHVGNNPHHCYMLDLIARDPGIVVLHDYVLNFLHDATMVAWQEPEGYRGAHELEYGALGAKEVRSRFEREDRGQFATYELPLNGDVLESATGIIVHSRYVQYKTAARVPRTPVWYVPHHLSPATESFGNLSRKEARAQLGLPEHEFIISALGFISYAKRISILLGALAELRRRAPAFRLVLAGEKRPREYDVDADIAASGLKDVTTCTGYVDETRFFQHLAASDLVANLRHPTGGESSGTLVRALGMGLPIVVLDHGPLGELPDSVVAKVPWGDESQSALARVLHELMTNSSQRSKLAQRAAAYARTHHDVAAIARRYANVIQSAYSNARRDPRAMLTQHFPNSGEMARALIRSRNARSAPMNLKDSQLWWSAATVPLGHGDQRALVVSCHPVETAEILRDLFAWPPDHVVAMTPDDFLAPQVRDSNNRPIRIGEFAFALTAMSADIAENRAAALFRRLNAALCRGGSLTLELSYLPDESGDAPLAEVHLPQRLIDAGFAVTRCVVPQDSLFLDLLVPERHNAQDRRATCIMARKVSSFAVWRYAREVVGTPMRHGGRIS